MGAWQFAEPRGGGPESGLILTGSPGYPNEAAAEVVLTALREWLEQHKDKVRPVPSRGDGTGWGSGMHSGPADQPPSVITESNGAEYLAQGSLAMSALPASPLLPLAGFLSCAHNAALP